MGANRRQWSPPPGRADDSPNLEFMAPTSTVDALARMLQLAAVWERGDRFAATRLHFLRHGVPVFVFAEPVFHGRTH